MFSEADLDAAVQAGVLTPATATAFRDFVARGHAAPSVDEEHFRLLSGFNDIFVSIATALLLTALGWLGGRIGVWAGGAAVAAASWALAEYFTRQRRMALPSILLLLAFVSSVIVGIGGLLTPAASDWHGGHDWEAAVCLAAGTAAAWLHWRRFRVPITVAAGAAAALFTLMVLVATALPQGSVTLTPLVFIAGLGMFALAMWWDGSDRLRVTRRADVAFWLHLAAAPLIVHPTFGMLGLLGRGTPDLANAAIAVLLYLVLAVIALAVDRRALLVSALAYVLYAISSLLRGAGSVSYALALAALVIGCGLLLLSALWQRARRDTVRALPHGLQVFLPPV